MPKRIIIATDSSEGSTGDRDAITEYLKDQGYEVWHWFDDLWLVDSKDDLVLQKLLDDIPNDKLGMVISSAEGEIDHAAWVSDDAIPWLKKHWNPRKES